MPFEEPEIKVVTILGTRPEIIRLSRIVPLLDQFCDHLLVHTGQNWAPELSDLFFSQLGLRQPDVHFGIQSATFGTQVGQMFDHIDRLLEEGQPDALLVLGDTNSGLCALPAARRGVPVIHLEAGNRAYDSRIPEELNRRVIDHASSVLLPYTQRSKDNLVREGFRRDSIFVVGNPIFEVLEFYKPQIAASQILRDLNLQNRQYLLATFHRSENVDDPVRLAGIVRGLERCAREVGLRVIAALHPRTRDRLSLVGVTPDSALISVMPSLGLFDFVHLEANSAAVLTDSGTVQEECAILHVPNVTLRDVTERPETIEAGTNALTGGDEGSMVSALKLALTVGVDWTVPEGYEHPNVSATVAKVVLGFRYQGQLR